jgi:CheY-like chemotaxis protein/HPt (histidine-containing phosphotransfer) domain-containing protein
LINDILDLAKVESGHLEFEREVCAPHAIIKEVVEILSERAQDKGIGLRFECDGKVPEAVITDGGRLRQIVTNLVGNAIKFTDRGGVKVVLSLRRTGDNDVLAIDVVDSGIGIQPDRLEAVFEPFVQAEESTTRRYGGTGLGLTISRRFARGLGGDIVARSDLGKGSVFSLTVDPGSLAGVRMLSAQEALASAAARHGAGSATWIFPPASVLVVDDGEANRQLVRLVLEEAGLVVEEAENGKVGLEKALSHNYGVILMDMQMPVMDGFTATSLLRERGCETPVFALTANAMKGFEREVLEAGCAGYLTKPVDIDALLETLATLLNGRRENARSQERATTSSAVNPTAAAVDATETAACAPIVSRLAAHPRLGAVARRFAAQLPDKMRKMEELWEVRDFDALAAMAHWLKGPGGTAGYDDFTAPARTLEELAKGNDHEQAAAAIAELNGLVARLSISDEEAVAAA